MDESSKSKKDFGLGKFRVTLPEADENSSCDEDVGNDDGSGNPQLLTTPEKPITSSPSFTQKLSSSVKGFFSKIEQLPKPSSPLLRRPRGPRQEKNKPATANLIDLSDDEDEHCSSGKPSPSLHSRVVKKDLFAGDGIKGSLENLKDEYGITGDDDDDMKEESEDINILRLVIKSGGNQEKNIRLQMNPLEGLGVRLSTGRPPVFVTQVEPDSSAMEAGINVTDVILEVNGKDCRDLDSTEVQKLLQLTSLIKKSPLPDSKRQMKESLTITSIDSESDDDDLFVNSSSQDRVSVDEKLFEYDTEKSGQEKFKPKVVLPSVKEESSAATKKTAKSTDLLIDLADNDSSTLNKEADGIQVQLADWASTTSTKRSKDSMQTTADEKSLDLNSVPSTQRRLGVDVGRYKRDIGKARKKRPTKGRPSIGNSDTMTDVFSSDKTDKNAPMKKPRSFSSSSINSQGKEKQVPKQKPPVAVRRKSSSSSDKPIIVTVNTLPEPSDKKQEDTGRRRYTVGAMAGGGNTQLLAQQAAITAARSKLRSSVKIKNEERKSTETEVIIQEKEKKGSINNFSGSKQQLEHNADNSGRKTTEGAEDSTKPSTSTVVDTSCSDKESSSTAVPLKMTTAAAPPKPPRLKDRKLSESEKDTEIQNNQKESTSSVTDKQEITCTSDTGSEPKSPVKPVPTPRKPSTTASKPISDASKNEASTTAVPKQDEETTKTKPAPITNKPTLASKTITEKKRVLVKSNNNNTDKRDSDDSATKKPTTYAVGNVRSKMAMFEKI